MATKEGAAEETRPPTIEEIEIAEDNFYQQTAEYIDNYIGEYSKIVTPLIKIYETKKREGINIGKLPRFIKKQITPLIGPLQNIITYYNNNKGKIQTTNWAVDEFFFYSDKIQFIENFNKFIKDIGEIGGTNLVTIENLGRIKNTFIRLENVYSKEKERISKLKIKKGFEHNTINTTEGTNGSEKVAAGTGEEAEEVAAGTGEEAEEVAAGTGEEAEEGEVGIPIIIPGRKDYTIKKSVLCQISMGDAHHDFKKIARKEFVMETIPIGDCEMIKDEDELLNELVDLPRSRIDSTESSIKSGIDSEGLNITIPSSGTEPEEENEEEDEGEDSEEKQHIIPDKPFIFNETEYLKNYIVGNVNHDSLINVLDNIIPNVPLFFIVDTCMGSFRKEITKKPLEGSIPRPLYWVQNAQTIYDPAGKTTISTDKGNKMFIEGENPNLKFVWDSSATKTYYPKWTFKKGKEIINYVDIDNKNELFYSKYDIYHINQKLDGEEHNYDSVAIIYNPEKKKYTIANKELSKIRSKVTELEYTENANFYEKMAKNLFKGSEPESFRNIINKRFVIKRLGDQGQALSCLTPVEKYSCYKNYRASSETEEILVGDGIHCFVTFDRPALVAALIYQLPMIIFNYHNGKFAIFIDKKYIGNNITEQKIKKIFNKQNENTLKIQLPRILEEYSKLYTEYSTIERAIYDSIEFINTKIKDDIHKNLDNTTITDEGYKGFLKTLAKLSPYMIQNSFYKKSNISFPSDEEYNILKERVKTIQTMKIEDIVKEINRYTGINQELKTMKSIHKEIFGIIPTIADYNTQIDKHKIDKHIESAINTTTITRNELRHPRSMDTVIERNTCISMVIDFYKNLKKFIDSADSYGVHDPIVLQAFEEYIRNILNYLINKTEGNPEYNNYVKTYITQIPEFEKILSPRENLAVAVSASASATGVPRKKEGGMYRNKEDYHATIYDMYDLLNTLFGICIEADAREKVCVFSKDPEKNKKMKDYMYKYIIEEKPRIYHKEPVKYNDIPYDSDDDVYFYNTFLNQIKWSPFAGVKEFFENVIDEYPTADTNVYIGEQLEATLYNIFERSNIRYRLNVKTRRRERNIQAEMRMKNTQYNELYPLPQKAQEQIAQMMKQRVPMSKIHELKNYEYKNEKSSYVTVAPYRNSMGGSRRYRKTKRRIPRPAPKKQTRRYKNPHRKTKKQRRIRK